MTAQRAEAERPPLGILLGVFSMSAAVLVFEVSLTRLFSAVLRYHFVFLVASVAICGLGLGGLLAHLTRPLRSRRPATHSLLVGAIGFGVLVPAALAFLLLWLLPNHPAVYTCIGGAILPPFICAGVFLSVCFEEYARQSGRLYAADLFGAAAASIGVVGILHWLGGINACLAAGGLGATAGVWVAGLRPPRAAAAPVVVAVAACALGIFNRSGRMLDLPPVHTDDPSVGKMLYRELADPKVHSRIEYSEWNAFARTDVVVEDDPDTRFLYTDGHVPTNMERWDGRLESLRALRGFLGYLALDTAPKGRALFIGPGGGLDVLMALAAGYEHIEGAEINASILNVMRRYRDFNGGVYERPNVKVAVGDGRSYVKRATEQYDLIYLACTQTATSGNVGLSLVESYIHTTDAIRDYLERLTPDGQLAFITQEYALSFRLFVEAMAVLTEGGERTEAEASRHAALIQVPTEYFATTPYRYLFLLSKQPLDARRSAALLEGAKLRRLSPIFIPGQHPGLPFAEISSGQRAVAQVAQELTLPNGAPANVSACTDDKPFFLDMSFGVPPALYVLCFVALLLSVGLTAVLAVTRRAAGRASHLAPFTTYFSLLGAGFMLVEIALAQKFILFLGYPTLTLSVTVFSILLGGAAGSRYSQRAAGSRLGRWVTAAARSAAGLVALYALALQPVQALLLGFGLPLRIVGAMLLLAPLGFALGIPFPTGVRLLERVNHEDIPWMWGVNGVTSVLGSVLAAVGAKLFGFRAVLLAGAVCYVFAALLGPALQRRAAAADAPSEKDSAAEVAN